MNPVTFARKCTITSTFFLHRASLKAQPSYLLADTVCSNIETTVLPGVGHKFLHHVYQSFVPAKPELFRHFPSVIKSDPQLCRLCNIRYGWYARMGTGPPIQHCGGSIELGERQWANLFSTRNVGQTRLDVRIRRTICWNDAPSILCHLATRPFRNLSRYSTRVSWKDRFCVSVSCVTIHCVGQN